MPMCNQPIGHKSTRTGKMIVPTLAFSCELQVGHDGPHLSASDRRSIQERAAWDAGARDRRAAQGELAKLQGVPQRTGAVDPNTGQVIPTPQSVVPCPLCRAAVAYADVVAHVMGHSLHGEARDGSEEAQLAAGVAEASPVFPVAQPYSKGAAVIRDARERETAEVSQEDGGQQMEMSFTSGPSSDPLGVVLDWLEAMDQLVQVPAPVAEAIQVLRTSRTS